MRFLTIALVLFATPAFALPPVPKYMEQVYGASPDNAKFVEAVKGLKSKCDVCHVPGADKKAKGHGLNDYGEALHKVFKDGPFKAADKEGKADEAKQLLADAVAKAAEAKNADGKTYGELIKAGLMPGKNQK